ncbi:hypothetical protein [Sinobaca sp. H24]|uniref:hypothetical protein n=1 Tax=Sinobaca sp. H24 TaxID=2923376 RepID=UPI002079DF70|nr:hypothetical protein [Sinobaca sp. H24]
MEFGTIDPSAFKLAERYVLSKVLLDTEPKPVSPAPAPAAFSYSTSWKPACQLLLERDILELERTLDHLNIAIIIDYHAIRQALFFTVMYRECEEKIIMQDNIVNKKLAELASFYTQGNNSFFVDLHSTC